MIGKYTFNLNFGARHWNDNALPVRATSDTLMINSLFFPEPGNRRPVVESAIYAATLRCPRGLFISLSQHFPTNLLFKQSYRFGVRSCALKSETSSNKRDTWRAGNAWVIKRFAIELNFELRGTNFF